MHPNHQSITFPFEARYAKAGEINEATQQIWFVIHGYGQLAEFFIKKFIPLTEHNICIIAPEGLSRFYLENLDSRMQSGNNRVGATWMTRENRLTDIRNYITYLNAIYKKEVGISKTPVTVLGFSQGAATATRWLLDEVVRFDRLILWAGIFPPDMDFEKGRKVFHEKHIHTVYGTSDPFLTEERFTEMNALTDKLGVSPLTTTFSGKHEIDSPTLLKLI